MLLQQSNYNNFDMNDASIYFFSASFIWFWRFFPSIHYNYFERSISALCVQCKNGSDISLTIYLISCHTAFVQAKNQCNQNAIPSFALKP